jgi:DNA processing protein
MAVRTYRLNDPGYPARLQALAENRPRTISIEGDFDDDERKTRIAIVGSRECHSLAAEFAFDFAEHAAKAGAVVVSGGAFGIDSAAHLGAMAGGGVTWAVLGCGWPAIWPQENEDLFTRIVASGGALLRPYPDGVPAVRARFLARNRVLVALCNAVLVVQAGKPSGALSSAMYALKLGRPLWVVPGAVLQKRIVGSALLMKDPRVHVVRSMGQLGDHFGIPIPDPDAAPGASGPAPLSDSIPPSDPTPNHTPELSPDEITLLQALSFTPKHPDQLSLETGLSAAAVSTALLTLALGDVVVEGSSGLFQRKKLVNR